MKIFACVSLTGILIVFSIILTSCEKSGRRSGDLGPNVTPTGWQTICLDRLLIDVPPNVQVGEAEPSYQAVYGFDGISDLGGKGQSWADVTIIESAVSTVQSYQNVYFGAAKTVATPDRYQSSIREATKVVQQTKAEIKNRLHRNSAEIARLADEQRDLADSRYGLKVSGKAKLQDSNAFAFRRGDEFIFGYLDNVDSRIRSFEGAISNLSIPSPEASAFEYRRFQQIYHRREPTDIPRGAGFCTAYGFIDEPDQPATETTLEIPFRSLDYPNLIFVLTVERAWKASTPNIQKLPDMDSEHTDLNLIGIKRTHGPVRETILGSPGRTLGYEFGPNCSRTSCRPADQAYEFESKTFGIEGRPDQPRLTLHMIAATSDDYRLQLPPQPDEPSYNKPTRPGLKGMTPPPYKEGKQIFEQVLRSIRLRPGAFAATYPLSTAASSPKQ